MKYVLFIFGALALAVATFLGLAYLMNQPADIVEVDNEQPYIEFVDLDMENPDCQPITEQIRSLLKQPQTCETAADCITARFGCPFGCGSNINISQEATISALIKERNQVCSTQCNYHCMSDGVEKIPACINNLCDTVEAIETSSKIRAFIDQNKAIGNN